MQTDWCLFMVQCFVGCCSVLQCMQADWCLCVTVFYRVLLSAAMCCNVMQCVAVGCKLTGVSVVCNTQRYCIRYWVVMSVSSVGVYV